MVKRKTSVSLSPEAVRLLREISQRLGLSQSGVLELAIRDYARKEGIEAASTEERSE